MFEGADAILNPVTCGNAVLGCLAAVSAATDLCCGKVYDIVTVPGLCLGVLLAVHRSGAVGFLDILCAAGFTVLMLIPFYRAGGLGAGDIKLLAAVSATFWMWSRSMSAINSFSFLMIITICIK